MPYCRNCRKMVSQSGPDASKIEVAVDGTRLTLFGPLFMLCTQCAKPVSLATLTAAVDLDAFFTDARAADPAQGETAIYELGQEPAVKVTDRRSETFTVGRGKNKGMVKPVTRPEQATRYYGAQADCVVVRTVLGPDDAPVDTPAQAVVTVEAEEKASALKHVEA